MRHHCVRVYATTYLACFSQSSSEQLASFHLAFIHKGRHILPTSVSLLVLETQCILRMLTVCERYCIILLRVIVCLFSFQMCHEKGCVGFVFVATNERKFAVLTVDSKRGYLCHYEWLHPAPRSPKRVVKIDSHALFKSD